MKRMMKRLAAIALAGAMVLSLSITALAADGDPVEKTTVASANGSANGTGSTTGSIPADVINIKLPTNAAAGTFDVTIDPHNLIRESGNALALGGSDATFADDTLVYFKNSGGEGVSFSKTSDPIKVINKSNIPIAVEMTAKWDKKTATYSLAKDAADFATAKANGEAALYLYLEDTKGNTSAVVEKEKGTPSVTFDTAVKTAGGGSDPGDLKYLDKYIKNVKFEYTAAADEQDIKLLNEGETGKTPADWAFTFTKVDKKTPTVAFDVSKLPNYVTLSGTTRKTDNAYKQVSAANVAITATLGMDGNYTYTVPGDKAESVVKIQKGTTDIALITIEWDYEAIGKNNYDITESVKDKTDANKIDVHEMKLTATAGEGAKIETPVNRTAGSYELVQATSTTLKWDFAEGFSAAADDDNKFQSVSFTLTGAITDGDDCAEAWDTAFPSSIDDTGLALVWKAVDCEAVDPSAEVTTEMASSGDSPVLKVDWGYGSKLASSITGGAFTNGNGGAGSIPASAFVVDDTDSSVITVNPGDFAAALWSGDGKVTLTFDTGATCVVALKAADAT